MELFWKLELGNCEAFMLPSKYRLSLEKDFDKVFTKGHIFFSPFFNIKILKNNLENSRFGIIISTKISKKAVIRNKVKRQIREIIQKTLPNIKTNFDIIILSKPRITISKFAELEKTFIFLLKKAGVYHKN